MRRRRTARRRGGSSVGRKLAEEERKRFRRENCVPAFDLFVGGMAADFE